MKLDLVWSGLYSFILNALIGYFVFKNNPKKSTNILFALFSLIVSGWSIGSFFENIIPDKSLALTILRISYIFGIWLPPVYIHFVYSLTGEEINFFKKIKLKIAYTLSAGLTFFSFSNLFINGLQVIGNTGFYISRPGPMYYLFFGAFGLGVSEVLFHTYSSLLKAVGDRRIQLKYITVANCVAVCAGFEYFSRVFCFFKSPPLDDYILVAYLLIVAYAIVRHHLMDIEIIVRRTAVFAGLFAFVYGTFTLITIVGQEFFRNSLGWNQWTAMIPTVLIITFALRPLENFLTNATQKVLFQKKYDYKELLKVFTNEILTVIDLEKLAQNTVQGLNNIIKLESVAMLMFDKESRTYKMGTSFGVKEKGVSFNPDSLLVQYLKSINAPIQKDKQVEGMDEGELKSSFKRLNAQVCIPIEHHDELIGILSLGMKKSGEEYTQEDLDVLTTLARTEAIAIANAQLFDELSKTQAEAAQREKMAVIGTLAAGINHEICNPLGIVRGQCEMFLLNLRDGFYASKSPEELLKISSDIMNKVIKETDRATAITKKLSNFAKPSKHSDFEEVAVAREVEEVLALLGHELRLSNIDIQKDFPENFPMILGDKKQIEEVLFNIIRNAAQAMDKKDGKIMVTGFRDGDWAVIRIADNGSGIPSDKTQQIFHPFYTTKAPGKGTGLGLFIVKQVVERNKGIISVESELGVGTTFTLRFRTAIATITSKQA